MKSELEAIEDGVEFSGNGLGRIVVHGPPGYPLRDEVVARIEIIKAWRERGSPPDGEYGKCDSCGMAMRKYAAGNCNLCCCAMQKIADENKKELSNG